MSNFSNFFDYIKNEFKNKNFDILDLDSITLQLLVGISSDSNSIFIKSANKGILFYERDNECVILGCSYIKTNNKFKQLLILTFDKKEGHIFDNTNNKIDKGIICETLYSWLIKDVT